MIRDFHFNVLVGSKLLDSGVVSTRTNRAAICRSIIKVFGSDMVMALLDEVEPITDADYSFSFNICDSDCIDVTIEEIDHTPDIEGAGDA